MFHSPPRARYRFFAPPLLESDRGDAAGDATGAVPGGGFGIDAVPEPQPEPVGVLLMPGV